MAEIEIELHHAKENIKTVKHHAIGLYERNQLLERSLSPSALTKNPKENHVSKTPKSSLAP